MYNDPNNDQNFYHYSYTPGGNEPGQRYDTRNPYNDACQTPPIRTTIPEVKPRKKRTGLKTVALALCCALLPRHKKARETNPTAKTPHTRAFNLPAIPTPPE
jgi:hypothetical protein